MESDVRKAGRPRSFDPDEALERALMVFWQHGYDGASIAQLQEATSLSAPSLYRAFDSKERLFERAVQRYQEQYGFGIRSDLPLPDAVTEYLERAAREFTTEPGRGCLVSTGLLATSPDSKVAAAVVEAERDRALSSLRDRLHTAVVDGELDPAADVDGLARTLAALIQGMSVQARDGASSSQLLKIARAGVALVRANM
ncbi:TetR/AcrR family transcriptional regulator [Rhodococcoides kyotonense]|uniref:DNA-binding transcriptional regulator, AcrR family n=1 Tax=Rhodococcoides kyotonense TaxID=398843 RepID=A0A239LF86_9NOCA|nr:TetR/AcrR family transcriptional regulator [Rhodococcus kyotonensis]SNT29131.1 DNA-binding transcriptional regulator, AcrR family [Rhodococcus kyotonensis]